MSLDRFINKEDILANNTSNQIVPIKWSEELNAGGALTTQFFGVNGAYTQMYQESQMGHRFFGNDNLFEGTAYTYAEMHFYSINDGSYVDSIRVKWAKASGYENGINLESNDIINKLSLKSGTFIVVVNILNLQLGSQDLPALKIQEISTDRTEIYLRGRTGHPDYATILSQIEDEYLENSKIAKHLRSGNTVLNFGKNRIYTILSQAGWEDPDGMVVKLHKPLSEDLAEESKAWINYEFSDPIVKYAKFVYNEIDQKVYLRTANFDAETRFNTITETEFKNYSDLLGSSTATSDQLIQQLISGSFGDAPIGVDYTSFDNFVVYSSAAERLANFKYKMQQIEHHDSQIGILQISASFIPTLATDKLVAESRKNEVIGSFDGFERWLYYESTSSLFTHQAVYDTEHKKGNPTRLEGGVLASDVYQIQPYPKFLSASAGNNGGGYNVLHPVDSTIATNWYNGTLASASLYDSFNDTGLVNTIPEHIRLDSNNDQFELFVNMIGHHYDILYSYADAIAKTYHPIEHPKLGHSKETLFNVAESLGWKLFNGNQASALWQYKMGQSETGSFYAQTGSIFTKSDEAITTEIWRRIVNNLPYLLKTKGTARGVKALMNTYGIPQSLLSIREYGGPKVAEDVPLLIEDRFTYALQFKSGSINGTESPHIRHGVRDYTTDIGSWGFVRPHLSSGDDIPSQTREFRFKPAVKQSMLLLTQANQQTGPADTRISSQIAIQYTGSYSGSDEYGRIVFSHGKGESTTQPTTGSTDWVPLYDGNFWNLRWYWQATGSDSGIYNSSDNLNTTYHIQVQQASDYINAKIVHSVSASYTPTGEGHRYGWNTMPLDKVIKQSYIGGYPGNGSTRDQFRVNTNLRRFLENEFIAFSNTIMPNILTYSGSMQEYREWLEDIGDNAFNLHTTNPTSYVSGIHPTASYDTLVRHYTLGTDLNAVDHSNSKYFILSSSHPAQTVLDAQLPYDNLIDSGSSFATMSFFPAPLNVQRGNYEPVEETYYVQGVSLGATLPKSQKIRFDDNKLITRLSTSATAETSKFDAASLDSNRLGLFYSPADQLNKEIFNQIGDVALDDFVGDPDDQYEYTYPDLTHFSKGYWKKYTDRNDINAYIRVFSQFDFSLFDSIRQTLPDRTDEVMGLIVEPHALERVKVVPFKKPEQEPLHYDGFLNGMSPTSSGEYHSLEGEVSATPSLAESNVSFHKGDNGYSDSGNYFGSFELNTSASADYFSKHIFSVDERPEITGSALSIYSVVQSEPPFLADNDHVWDIANGGNINVNDGVYMAESAGTVEGLPFASDKIRIQYKTYNQTDTIQDIRVNVTHLDQATGGAAILYGRIISTHDNEASNLIRIESTAYPYHHITETAKAVFTFSGTAEREDTLLFKDVHIPRRTNVTLELFYSSQLLNGVSGHAIRPVIDSIDFIRTISKAGHTMQGDFIDVPRPSKEFKKKKFHYHESNPAFSKRKNDEQRVISESLHHSLFTSADDSYSAPSSYVYSQSLVESHYRDDENNNISSRYIGSSLTAPGINILSGYSELGYEPVVEIFITNPNQIVYNTTPQVTEQGQENPGNLSVSAGPAILVQRPTRPSISTGRPNVSYR